MLYNSDKFESAEMYYVSHHIFIYFDKRKLGLWSERIIELNEKINNCV